MDVVISGIGGRFPLSQNVKEFSDHLLSGKNLLTPPKIWPPGAMNTPKMLGQTDSFSKFDYTFFGIHYELAKSSDPLMRAAAETAFEAVIDAGINPATLRGTNAHVYAATTQTEADCFFNEMGVNLSGGYVIMGRNRCMSANRISYIFHLTGRSCAIDASGGWLGIGLDLARRAIQSGECDTVFLSGSSVIVLLEMSKQKLNMGLLSEDSRTRPFDFDVDGVARGDAQVTFLVQRADIAKRSYGSIVAAGAEHQGHLPNWFLSINEDHLRGFLHRLYTENGINPNDIKLLEADGLCIRNMVESELNVYDDALNEKRTKDSPLYLGSVKTVTGDTDGGAGHTGLTKLILALETGIISPTLDCGNPNPNIRGITDGRFKVVTEPTKWEVTPDTHVAISTLSTSGVVSHVVLKANGKSKPPSYENNYPIPFLILMSGRSEGATEKSLRKVTSSPFDPEYIRLTHEVFSPTIDKFEWRGYGFHGQDEEKEKFVVQRENRRPVWFVYSGMGSQWAGMGKNLMLFPIARETLLRCHKILEPKGLDLLHILTTPDEAIFDNILHSFVGIASIQIALTNVLFRLGIKFDGVIGHSVGELGCSYADGCLTEEQTLLAAYERGMASLKADLIQGLMAAVGVGYKEAKDLLPPDVFVACHNSSTSCTISGPTESVKKTIESLKEKDIFVRGVNASNIAYHSPYIKPAAPFLHEALRKVIPDPKPRSKKWICTSAPAERWDDEEVRLCSADYHTNNLLSAVLFEEGCAHIPKNALAIEIAPHGLLQAILKRSLGNDVANVALTRRNADIKLLLEAIGKLFLEGLSPQIWHLYPDVTMPVSRGTPSLAPLLEWNHDEVFGIPNSCEALAKEVVDELTTASPSVEIAGDLCLLSSYVLVMVWKKFADMNRWTSSNPVVFENVRFSDAVRLDKEDIVRLGLIFLPATGRFDVTRNDVLIAQGTIREKDEEELKKPAPPLPPLQDTIELHLGQEDIYSEIKTRSIGVADKIKTIRSLDIYSQDWVADVGFDEDWTTLLNSLLMLIQLQSSENQQNPSFLHHIRQMTIVSNERNDGDTTARLHIPSSTLTYKGIIIHKAEYRAIEKPVPKSLPASVEFVPYGETGLEDDEQFLCHVIQLCLDKRLRATTTFKLCDFDGEYSALTEKLRNILQREFSLKCELMDDSKDAHLVLCGLDSVENMSSIFSNTDCLFLTRASRAFRDYFERNSESRNLRIVAGSRTNQRTSPFVAITRVLPPLKPADLKIIKMKPHEKLSDSIRESRHSLIIFLWENGTNQPIERVLAQVALKECSEKIRLIFLMTPDAPPFSVDLPLYADQIRLNVPLNVYFDGRWGSHRLIPVLGTSQTGPENILIQPDRSRNRRIDFGDLQSDTANEKSSMPKSRTVGYCEDSGTVQKMGVGVCSDLYSQRVTPDPLLHWSIPPSWDLESAASVPFAYATAYIALYEFGLLKEKERIFVTGPLTNVGQAAIRIAKSKDCVIAAMVASPREKMQLQQMFPWIKSSHILVTKSDAFTMELKKIFPGGIDVIFSDLVGRRLRAATTCLAGYGRFIQVGEDAMLNADFIGLHMFLQVVCFYGVSRDTLLKATEEVKQRVVKWVQEGLESGVVVPPTGTESVSKPLNNGLVNGSKPNGTVEKAEEDSKSTFKAKSQTRKSCVIVGGSKAQWVRLAYCLARKGYKLAVSVQENPSPNLIARHSKILQREFGLELREVSPVKSGASLLNNNAIMDPIKDIFIFDHNTFAEEVASLLESRKLKDTRVTFFSSASTQFSRMCERWDRDGLRVRAALGVEDAPSDAETSYLEWILSPAAPAVSVLRRSAFGVAKSQLKTLRETGLLPSSLLELRALGSSIRRGSPLFRELVTPSRRVRQTREVDPLFFVKGLTGAGKDELESLAADLLAPLVEVTLPVECGSLNACAEDFIQSMQRIQQSGPYNLAGDTLRIDLVMRIAGMLEERGHASVVFLVDEGLDRVRQGLIAFQQENRLGETLIKSTLADSIDPVDWINVNWGALSWAEQVEAALSKVACSDELLLLDARLALNHIYQSLLHIIDGQDVTLEYGFVHTFKKGDAYREHKLRDRVVDYTIPSSKLSRRQISDIITPNLATPVMQLEIDRSKRRSLLCNSNQV